MNFFKILFFLLMQFWLTSVQAHAFIEQQYPKAGEELKSSPKAITLIYNKNIEPIFSSIQILNEKSGAVINTGNAEGIEDEPNKLVLPLPNLRPGEYRVKWIALSRDGHRTTGDYTFIVQ